MACNNNACPQQCVAAADKHRENLLRVDKTSRKTRRHAEMEKAFHAQLKDRLKRVRKSSARWLSLTAMHIMKTCFSDRIGNFKARRSWLIRFLKRHHLNARMETDQAHLFRKKLILQQHFKRFRLFVQSVPQRDSNYGRFPPHMRLNVDQVLLPFINCMMDTTCEEKGAKNTWIINQLNPALNKQQFSAQLCSRPPTRFY